MRSIDSHTEREQEKSTHRSPSTLRSMTKACPFISSSACGVCVANGGHVRHIICRIDRAQPKTQGPACCGVHHHTTKADNHHHIYIKSNPQPPKPPQTQAPRALLAFLTRLARCTSKGVISAMLEPELILVWWVQGMVCV